MATEKTTKTIEIKGLSIKYIPIKIVGDTPLMTHAWDEKAKRMMLEAQMKKEKTKKKQAKMPFDDFARSLHWITEMPTETIVDPSTKEPRDVVTEELFDKAVEEGARWGFPADGIKKAAASAAYRLGWISKQTELKSVFFINGEDNGSLIEIKGCLPEMSEDPVKIQMTNDIRYRAVFNSWYMDAFIEYNESGDWTLEDIINCINAGGYACGIGEWRPERNGRLGRFHVEMRK